MALFPPARLKSSICAKFLRFAISLRAVSGGSCACASGSKGRKSSVQHRASPRKEDTDLRRLIQESLFNKKNKRKAQVQKHQISLSLIIYHVSWAPCQRSTSFLGRRRFGSLGRRPKLPKSPPPRCSHTSPNSALCLLPANASTCKHMQAYASICKPKSNRFCHRAFCHGL